MADVNQLNVYLRCLVRARPSLTSLFWIADVNGTTVTDDDVTSDYWSTVTVRVSSFHALQFDICKVMIGRAVRATHDAILCFAVQCQIPQCTSWRAVIFTFCVSRRRRKMYCGHARLCVCVSLCVSVCLSVSGRTPTLLHGPGCNLRVW